MNALQTTPLNFRVALNVTAAVNLSQYVIGWHGEPAGPNREMTLQLEKNDISTLLEKEMRCCLDFATDREKNGVIKKVRMEGECLWIHCDFEGSAIDKLDGRRVPAPERR